MKRSLILATLVALFLAHPGAAQTQIEAPTGWKTQTKTGGAQVFTPPDLKAGEKYSITVYDSAPLGGKTPEAWLRAFAGPVGTKPGQLTMPLQIETSTGVVTGVGFYGGPNGTALTAIFAGISIDGKNIHVWRTLCSVKGDLLARYTGASKQLGDEILQRARIEAGLAPSASTAKDKPYPWMVAPGQGVRPAQIAALIYCTDYGSVSGFPIEQVVLLLRDGTAINDLPCAPDQLDVALSRRNDSGKWGLWRRQGDKYLVSWGGEPFKPLPSLGLGFPMTPGSPQTRLSGRYSAARSVSVGSGGSYLSWGVTFDASGRFTKDSQGGTSAHVGAGESAMDVTSTFGDGGSAVTASGSGVTAMAARKGNPNGDREGTYSINGFNLTRRYDNGQVAHLPFFLSSPQRESIWFEGSLLTQLK